MCAVTRMPLMIVVVWVAIVHSECITNPMDEINQKAKEQYQITDEVLKEMKKSTPHKYKEVLRLYGLYRACIESDTKRWTDNVGTGSGSCPYCRTKIEEEDKITKRPMWPKVQNSSSCKKDKFCHESQQGCFYYGVQGSEEECKRLGENWDGRDGETCMADGNSRMYDYTCVSCRYDEWVRTDHCSIMCGYCRPRCDFFCKNWGYMKADLCECDCDNEYNIGKDCGEIDCSRQKSDSGYCTNFSKEQCEKEVKSTLCPYLCGLCKTS